MRARDDDSSAAARRGTLAPTLRLPYRAPLDHAGLQRFFARRALPGVEWCDVGTLRRSLRWTHAGRELRGWLECCFAPDRQELQVTLAPALAPAAAAIGKRVRSLYDLDADPAQIQPVLAAAGLAAPAGVRVPGALDGFETAARIVVGQQVSVAAARTLAGRLVAAYGEAVATPWPQVHRLFPSARALVAADATDIGRLGIVRRRVTALQALARTVVERRVELRPGAPVESTLQALRALPGIGDWSAQMIALRVLGWPDAFPATDSAVLRAFRTRDPALATALAQRCRPWRAYLVAQLWQQAAPGPSTGAVRASGGPEASGR